MPARTSPVVVKKIRHLRQQGWRICDIADEVGVNRNTVATYTTKVDKVDDQADLADVLGGLTAHQRANLMRLVDLPVDHIAFLLRGLRGGKCDKCAHEIAYLASMTQARCPGCGKIYGLDVGDRPAR